MYGHAVVACFVVIVCPSAEAGDFDGNGSEQIGRTVGTELFDLLYLPAKRSQFVVAFLSLELQPLLVFAEGLILAGEFREPLIGVASRNEVTSGQ